MPQPHPFIAELLSIEPPKTWSFIATIFGDLDGDSLSGKQIGALLANAGIKPEASRVALHRLRNDGWIISRKSGREVSYSLSDHGRAETFSAQKDVYRRDVKFPEGWAVFGLNPDGPAPAGPCIVLGKNMVLAPERTQIQEALQMSLPQSALPSWVVSRLVPAHLTAHAERLADLAETFGEVEAGLSETDRSTARLLFIHFWRKMALRPGVWAHIGLLPDGDLARCHNVVTELLARSQRLTPPEI